MPENIDLLGLSKAHEIHTSDPEMAKLYLELGQAILESQRRTTLVQEFMQLDSQEGLQEKSDKVESVNSSAASVLVRLHNEIANKNRYALDKKPGILSSQEQADAIFEEGISVLTPEQARVALDLLEKEIQATKVLRDLHNIAEDKLSKAKQEKDLTMYLLWRSVRRSFTVDWVIGMSECIKPEESVILTADEFVKLLEEEDDLERWGEEAKMMEKLKNMLEKLPKDVNKVRVAMLRMPKRVDSDRRVRVLIDFPVGTHKGNGGQWTKAGDERVAFYSGHSAPACVEDAYYRFYQLTRRKKDDGQFEARPFFVSSYVAEGSDSIEGFPDEARNIIEIDFGGDDKPISNMVETHSMFPNVIYAPKEAIDSDDLEQVYIGDDGLAHFIMGKDDRGNPIRQDTVQYSMKALLSGFSNVVNVPVVDFM